MDTRRLDLLLLAGCSCLLTLLYQPIAHAIVAPQMLACPSVEQSVFERSVFAQFEPSVFEPSVFEQSVPPAQPTYGDFASLVTFVP